MSESRTTVYTSRRTATFTPPLIYRLFFLYIEPFSALVGAYYAAFKPDVYLSLLTPSSAAAYDQKLPAAVLISLYQLANLYLLFTLVEYLVLSSTSSLKTWRRLLVCLLIADFGHLSTMVPLATEMTRTTGVSLSAGLWRVFGQFWEWNAMEWGSIGFVYAGASMRISFLVLTSKWWRAGTAETKED